MSTRKATARTTRAPRPQLDSKIYRWLLAGRPAKNTLSLSARIKIFVLEDVPVCRWACSRGPNFMDGRCEIFWNCILRKVEEGELEVVTDVDHKIDDPPLVTEEEALSLML
jgi:hypothetical protein